MSFIIKILTLIGIVCILLVNHSCKPDSKSAPKITQQTIDLKAFRSDIELEYMKRIDAFKAKNIQLYSQSFLEQSTFRDSKGNQVNKQDFLQSIEKKWAESIKVVEYNMAFDNIIAKADSIQVTTSHRYLLQQTNSSELVVYTENQIEYWQQQAGQWKSLGYEKQNGTIYIHGKLIQE